MADREKTVEPSGGDYTSLDAAITGEDGPTTGDLVSDQERLVLRIQGNWASNDNTAVDVTGFTTDSDYYVYITTFGGTGAAIHDGTHYKTNSYELSDTSGHVLTINEAYTVVEGFAIYQGSSGSSDEGIRMAAGSNESVVNACIVYTDTYTTDQDGIYCWNSNSHDASHTIYVYNSLIFTWLRGGINYQCYVTNSDTQDLVVRNCTIIYNGSSGVNEGAGINLRSDSAHSGTLTCTVYNTICGDNWNGIAGDQADYISTGSGTGSITWAGDYNANTSSHGNDQMPGGNSVNATSGITDSTSPGAGTWISFVDADGGYANTSSNAPYAALDAKLLDDDDNDMLAAGTSSFIPPSPFEKDCLFQTRDTSNIDIGWHAVNLPAAPAFIQRVTMF